LLAERFTATPDVEPGGRPLGAGLQGEVEDAPGQRRDEPRALGERHEGVGRHDAALRVVPAHERLDRADRAGDHVDLRLHRELELLARAQRMAQVGEQGEPVGGLRVVLGAVVDDAAALALGDVHRDVRAAHDVHADRRVARWLARDADARADAQLDAVDRQRRLDRDGDGVGERARLRGRADRGDDDELVAAGPPDEGAAAGHGADPAADGAQHLVADRVAEAVVDRLEVVEVDEQHRDERGLARALGEQRVQALAQGGAVAQAGQRVLVGQVAQLALQARALAGVAQRHHDAAHVGVGEEVRARGVDLDPARAAAHAQGGAQAVARDGGDLAEAARERAGGRRGARRRRTGRPARGGEQRAGRAGARADGPVGADDEDRVGRLLDDAAVPAVAAGADPPGPEEEQRGRRARDQRGEHELAPRCEHDGAEHEHDEGTGDGRRETHSSGDRPSTARLSAGRRRSASGRTSPAGRPPRRARRRGAAGAAAGLRPVAALELLARPAPARVVAPDLLLVGDVARLDQGQRRLGADRPVVGREPVGRRRGRAGRRGERARLGRAGAAGVAHARGAAGRGRAPRPARAGRLGPARAPCRRPRRRVLDLDLDLYVEHEPGELVHIVFIRSVKRSYASFLYAMIGSIWANPRRWMPSRR
jgi:hypothetical protein